MAGPQSIALSDNDYIDALLTGYKWDTTNLSYSFPDSGIWYLLESIVDDLDPFDIIDVALEIAANPGTSLVNLLEELILGPFGDSLIVSYFALNDFDEFTASQQAAAEAAHANLEGFTLLNFNEVDEGDFFFEIEYDPITGLIPIGIDFGFTHGLLRYAESGAISASAPGFGIPPLPTAEILIGEGILGDTWYLSDDSFDNAPLGSFAAFTIMHETGHAIGLKHAHEAGLLGGNVPGVIEDVLTGVSGPIVAQDKESVEFSIMSYKSTVGGNVGYTNETNGFPTTYMMLDIQALQYMYGANYVTNATDTTYSWDPNSGTMSINGAAQLQPGANRVFLTIWDGGGNDTYDLSNYTTGASINLLPGEWTKTADNQLADLTRGNDRSSGLARGNVANALLYNGDTRSLIENAIGGSGDDTIVGNDADNILSGNGGNDNLTGGIGNDTLNGDAGNDVMAGGDGDDTLNGGTGNDTMTGGVGGDMLTGGVGDDSLDGGDGDDTLNAGAGNDVVEGGAGNDQIDGGDGDDTLRGGPGIDTILGGAGADLLEGGDGDDVLTAGLGNDTAQGGAGADQIDGDDGNDNLAGGDGADVINGASGNDSISGDGDADTITGGAGLDVILGGAGGDAIDGGADADEIHGGDGDDTITAGTGNDVVTGDAGNDNVDAGDGNDAVDGGDGDDTLDAGDGDDTVTGGIGDDLIRGGAGVDLLMGGAGNDTIFGGDGNDSLFGEDGNDTLAGGAGQDLVDGGAGIDTASFVDATGPVVVNLQDPTQMTGDASGDVYISIERFELSNFDDTFIGLDDPLSGDVVSGLDGNDTLLGFAGDDELHGDGGDDYIVGGRGADIVDGGVGFDTTSFEESKIGIVVDLVDPSRNTGIAEGDAITSVEQFFLTLQGDEFVGLAADETVHGLHGNDLISTNGGDDTVYAGDQHDTVFGGTGNDVLYGENGNDTIHSGDGNDVIEGGADHDVLFGGNGADMIRGGTGDDYIAGGAGDDTLWGDAGKDNFAFAANGWGFDLIMDFQDKVDRIEIDFDHAQGIHGMDEIVTTQRIGVFGVETAITLASGDPGEIVLVGLTANQVNHQDILFI